MWSHECDSYSLTKQEKGGRVWEYLEGVVGWMKGGVLPLFSANCFCESQSCQKAVTKSGPHSIQCGLGALAPVKPHHMASLSSNSRIWGFCLGTHFLAVAVLPVTPFFEPQFCPLEKRHRLLP